MSARKCKIELEDLAAAYLSSREILCKKKFGKKQICRYKNRSSPQWSSPSPWKSHESGPITVCKRKEKMGIRADSFGSKIANRGVEDGTEILAEHFGSLGSIESDDLRDTLHSPRVGHLATVIGTLVRRLYDEDSTVGTAGES